MTRSPTALSVRQRRAEQAYRALGPSPSESLILAVHCARGHHVAGVYATAERPVYVSIPWHHGHGRRDRHDAVHHGGRRDKPWIDWIAPGADVGLDDALPAGCECGPRSLSRARLLQARADGVRRLVID